MTAAAQPFKGLQDAISNHLTTHGVSSVQQYDNSSLLLLTWLKHLHQTKLTDSADYMLEGVGSLIREAGAYLAMGLVRAAMFSMRGQIDLTLSWLYFKDHPTELKKVESTGKGYKLASEVLAYLGDVNAGFKTRFGILEQVSERKAKDPFHILSAHVHGQSKTVIPSVDSFDQVVQSAELAQQFVQLQRDASEYLSDVLTCVYMIDWAAIPEAIRFNFEARKPSPQQRTALFG